MARIKNKEDIRPYISPRFFNISASPGSFFAYSRRAFSSRSSLSSSSLVYLVTGVIAVLLSHITKPINPIIPAITTYNKFITSSILLLRL